ncbi:MAG: hypothetical protein FWG81_03180 [Betaproteobacteria bacterium]|nr:hypothetical protein [Betaproteobacteria bacterium]
MEPIIPSSLWRRHIVPFFLLAGLLALATLAGDFLLHRMNLVWVGRYLGIPGTLLIIISFLYSLRKRKLITSDNPKALLAFHEFCAWFGSFLVLLHAGIHFNSILPWLATVAMSVGVISGLVGKLLLNRARHYVTGQREHFQLRGLSRPEVEQAVFWDAVALDAMNRWRKVHIPIFIAFALLSIGHIFSVFLFWGWK